MTKSSGKMTLLDYFFHVLAYSVSNDPKMVANIHCWPGLLYDERRGCGLLSLWCSAFLITLLSVIGFVFGDNFPELAKPETIVGITFIFSVMAMVFIFIRYFSNKRYLKIYEWRNGLSKVKRRILYTTFLILFWPMPIAAFVTYRLCVFGQVKWW
jgi:hypothetical protein